MGMRSILTFKWRWVLYFIFVIFSFILVFYAQEPPSPADSGAKPSTRESAPAAPKAQAASVPSPRPASSSLKVKKAVVCLDISEDGRPLLAKEKFGNVDYLYCYSEITGAVKPLIIVHRWVYGTETIDVQRVGLDPDVGAVWTKLDIPPGMTGQWRVDILTSGGTILDYVLFEIQ